MSGLAGLCYPVQVYSVVVVVVFFPPRDAKTCGVHRRSAGWDRTVQF